MAASKECLVRVRQGWLQGKKATTCNGKVYYSFEGIPYAKPPVAELRFRPPQPIENWSGVKDTTKPGNKCAQMDIFSANAKFQGSEDCLYLNVYTPTLPQSGEKKYPVLFYVHGGRNMFGYGDYYRPDFYLEQDCILVTINYRLHILGYLCLHSEEVPGNAGHKDAICALRWVKDNIGVFNGDSGNVIAYGESIGAGIVSGFMASNMADKLFHKAITESGSCIADPFFRNNEDAIEKAKTFCKILGYKTNSVKEIFQILTEADVKDLVKAVGLAQRTRGIDISPFFLPVVEKQFPNTEAFYTEDPWKIFQEGRFKKVPLITGHTSNEGAYTLQKNEKGEIVYIKDLESLIPVYLGLKKGSEESKKFAETLRKFYFGDKEINDDMKEAYVTFMSDTHCNRDFTITLEYQAQFNTEVYYFVFDYQGSLNTRTMKAVGLPGAAHGDVLPYQFYRSAKMNKHTEKDWEVIRFFSEAFCNFAKYGRPFWSNQKETWRQYTQNKKYYLEIGDTIICKPSQYSNRIDIWKSLMFDKCKL